MKRNAFLIAFLLCLLLAGCNLMDFIIPAGGGAQTGRGGLLTGSDSDSDTPLTVRINKVTATIAGAAFSGTGSAYIDNWSAMLYAENSDYSKIITIYADSPESCPETQELKNNQGANAYAEYTAGDDTYETYTSQGNASGSVTFINVTDDMVSGTFEFTAKKGTTTVTIQNGLFTLPRE